MKQVKVPDSAEVLLMDETELETILNMKITTGKKYAVKSNTFVPYAISTDNFSEIQRAYMNVKLANAGARHIVCAWNIPGEETALCCDFQDDEDHGAGRAIAQLLCDNDIQAKAVFIARYSSMKLGNLRFQAYTNAAAAVLNQAPYNTILQKEQMCCTDIPRQEAQQNEENSPPAKKPAAQLKEDKIFYRRNLYQNPAKKIDRRNGRGSRGGRGARGGALGVTDRQQQQKIPFAPKTEEALNKAMSIRKSYSFRNPDKPSWSAPWGDSNLDTDIQD